MSFSASIVIPLCIATSCGAPALAPIGTSGAAALGVPFCLDTGGSAVTQIVGTPAFSIALCTIVAER